MIETIVARDAGFCFGVRQAVTRVQEALAAKRPLYVLAPIVHNRHVMAKLQEAGLALANSLDDLETGDVLVVPSHGMTVEDLTAARERGIEVLDLTCPRVRRSQEQARELASKGLHVLIVGDPAHTEVRSVASWAGGPVTVVPGVEAARRLTREGRWGLVSQTTARPEDVEVVIAELRNRAAELIVVPTACQVAAAMQDTVRELAQEVDVMLVIGGRTSANTTNLAVIAASLGTATHHIESAVEVDPSWLQNTTRVGIAAGASTPDWLIEEVVTKVKEIDERARSQDETKDPAETEGEQTVPETKPEKVERSEPASETQPAAEAATRPEPSSAAEAGSTGAPAAPEPEDAEKPVAEEEVTPGSREHAEEIKAGEPAAAPVEDPEVSAEAPAGAQERVPCEKDVPAEAESVPAGTEPEKPEAEAAGAVETAKPAAEEEPSSEEPEAAEAEPTSMEGVKLLSPGDIVSGRVVEVRPGEGILVDVGYKTEGLVPVSELAKRSVSDPLSQFSPDDEVTVQVLRFEGDEGTLVLSKRRADEEKTWGELQAVNANGEPVEGKVTQAVKGGLLVDVGVRAFLPASHVGTEFVRDLQPYVGRRIKVKVIEIDRKDRKVILSERSYLEEERRAQAEELWASIAEGDVKTGVVKRLTDFGAFIDLGGVDGLLHISELSWGRVNHPSEVVHEGEEVEVKVLRVDRERNRISLSKKQVGPDPWETAAIKFPPGSVVTGKVVRLVPFGAFVQLDDGIDGLVHISQISDQRIAKPEDVLQVGQDVKVKVLSVSQEAKRISLSIREAEQDRQRTDYRSYLADQPSREVTVGEMLAARNAEDSKREEPLAATETAAETADETADETAADRDAKEDEPPK